MKKLLLLITIALTFSCAKKEDDPKPVNQQQIQQPETDMSDKVKVTVWSNRTPYIYRRKKLHSDWKEDNITTKTAVFYEEYCNCLDGQGIKYIEYAMLATHSLSIVKGDSISIKIEYQGKKAYNLNVVGNTFAITHMIDMK